MMACSAKICRGNSRCCSSVSSKSSRSSFSVPVYSRIASSASVSSVASLPEYDLRPNMKMSDIRNRLSELIGYKGSDLIQACKNFDRRSTNKIPKSQFRQVLRTFCFPITAAQFESLCNEMKINHSAKMNYIDFFSKLSDGKDISMHNVSEKIDDDIPIDEVELRIKNKIKSRLYDVVRAFWLFDINKDGFIQKSELRRVIRNYCFNISDELFNNFWKSYDPKSTGIIKYKDFLIKIGINADRYQKYMPQETVARALCQSDKTSRTQTDDRCSDQRSLRAALENRDDPAIQGLPMEEVMAIFMDRLQQKMKILMNAFNLFDYEKNGLISLSDFYGIINFYVIAMSPSLFNRAFQRLDINCVSDNKLRYEDFLKKYCKGSSNSQQSHKREAGKLDCYPIVQRIKNHVINPDSRLRSVFTKISPDKGWQVTRQELKRAIELGLDFRLSDEELKELTSILDPGNTNVINCTDFLQLFDGPCDSVGMEGECPTTDISEGEKYVDLRGNKLKSKLKHHINKNTFNIQRAILVCDPNQSGFILPEKLHHILEGFCFPLTNGQFSEVTSGFKLYGDSFNYKEFLDSFKKTSGEDTEKWISTVNKLATFKSRCPPELPIDEVEEMLKECVESRKTAMMNDFKALDVCNVGVTCKDDARNVFNKFAFRFNDKQFKELWKKFPVNKYDQLLYTEFLEEYSGSSEQQNTKLNLSAKDRENNKTDKSNGAERKKVLDSSETNQARVKATSRPLQGAAGAPENRKSAKEIVCVNAPHLKPILDSMESAIVRNYRTIRFHLRRADPKTTGLVDLNVLKNILAKSAIFFSKEDEFHILEYFDSHLTGKINYIEFLRTFVWYA